MDFKLTTIYNQNIINRVYNFKDETFLLFKNYTRDAVKKSCLYGSGEKKKKRFKKNPQTNGLIQAPNLCLCLKLGRTKNKNKVKMSGKNSYIGK